MIHKALAAALLLLPACAAAPRETLSLDGPWQIVFDRKNEGRAAGWHIQKTPSSATCSAVGSRPCCARRPSARAPAPPPPAGFPRRSPSNVCAAETLEGLATPPIVGSLSFSWGQTPKERNYQGPREVWWDADMVDVPHGKGRMLLSTLRLLENLEKDPVAERILCNLIRWAQEPK